MCIVNKKVIKPAWVMINNHINNYSGRKMKEMKRLYRSGKEKIIAGVCGGIAEYLGIDPTIVRLVWILFSLVGGAGILFYLIAWLVIPRNPQHKWWKGQKFKNIFLLSTIMKRGNFLILFFALFLIISIQFATAAITIQKETVIDIVPK